LNWSSRSREGRDSRAIRDTTERATSTDDGGWCAVVKAAERRCFRVRVDPQWCAFDGNLRDELTEECGVASTLHCVWCATSSSTSTTSRENRDEK